MTDAEKVAVLAKTLDTVAQLSHSAWGALVWLVPFYRLGGVVWAVVFAAVWAACCAWKEFVYDESDEIPEVRGSSLKDFLFAMLGTAAAAVVTLV